MGLQPAGRVNDPTNITGLGLMLQGDEIGSEVDWHALERSIIGNIGANFNIEAERHNLDQDYANDIQRLSNQFGIGGNTGSLDTKSILNMPTTTSNNNFVDNNSISGKYDISPPGIQQSLGNRTTDQNGGFFGNISNTKPMNNNAQNIFSNQTKPITTSENSNFFSSNYSNNYNDSQMNNMTHEQQQKHVIGNVLESLASDNSDNNTGITEDLAREREIDIKIRHLDQIHSLRTSLQEDNVDIDRIPNVSLDNSIQEISEVLKYLLIISDNKRCSVLAEEFILMGAQGAGFVCNGKRTLLGRRPDLSDWHKTVAVKLRHLRHDTSMLVSRVMKKYKIGSGWRIAMELLPSMFYHSATRSKRTESDYISDVEFNDAIGTLRDMNND